MADHTSRLENLLDKLKNDRNLASKLDLIEEISNDNTSKRKPMSPLKTKKVKLSVGSHIIQARSPDGTVSDYDTSAAGASCSQTIENVSVRESENDSESDGSDLEALENLYSKDDAKIGSESEDEFNILGQTSSASWSPSEKALKFYLKVADLELSKEVIANIKEDFKCEADLDSHFSPPKFPSAFWDLVQNSSADSTKLKSLYKCQEKLYLALKPLLSLLDSCPSDQKDNLSKAIQLITSTNLTLNRYRRVTIAPHLKSDIRKQLLALPVHHDAFFGKDFAKSSDVILKENAVLEKIVRKPLQNYKRPFYRTSTSEQPSYQNQQPQKFFRGNKRGRYPRNRGGRGYQFSKGSRNNQGNFPHFSRNPPNPHTNHQSHSS